VTLKGWAIEARLYAEDPLRNFLPSIGRLTRYLPPTGMEGVRVDTGVYEGGEISMYYDPMIAKLVGFGKDRKEATARLGAALDAYYVRGVNHNISFLAAIMAHPRFRAGKLTTGFIAEEFPHGFHGRALDGASRRKIVAVAAFLQRRQAEEDAGIAPRARRTTGADWVVRLAGNNIPVHVADDGLATIVTQDGTDDRVESLWAPGQPLFRGQVGEEEIIVQVDRAGGTGWKLFHAGALVDVQVLRPLVAELAALMPVKRPPDTSKFLLSPMPGLLKTIAV
jgi:propionyl-CoA carboxylase alpha chain